MYKITGSTDTHDGAPVAPDSYTCFVQFRCGTVPYWSNATTDFPAYGNFIMMVSLDSPEDSAFRSLQCVKMASSQRASVPSVPTEVVAGGCYRTPCLGGSTPCDIIMTLRDAVEGGSCALD